jgi:hypothetical protein
MWAMVRYKERGSIEERELADECEVFLSGHYPQYLNESGRSVPEWAWVNILAHGSEEDIRAFATGAPRVCDATWHHALAFLAQEVVSEAARRGADIADLQRTTLVPLELELAASSSQSEMRRARVVGSVLSALAELSTKESS